MREPLALFLTAMAGFLAGSSSFWVYLRNSHQARSANTRLLMGLAHDKIMHLGMKYIDRGWITSDEYEDFRQYLFEPYAELGGNGTAEQVMHAVQRLPLRPNVLDSLPIRETDPTANHQGALFNDESES